MQAKAGKWVSIAVYLVRTEKCMQLCGLVWWVCRGVVCVQGLCSCIVAPVCVCVCVEVYI